jgi:hypothetical protein
MPTILELIVPGLLGPVPPPARQRPTPTIDLLLDRAAVEAGASHDLPSALLAAFGAEASAPFALAADDSGWDRTGWWLHADPVHLRPDRDLLRLFDAPHLGISRAEADALVAELNRHFAEDGLRFHVPVADRWYLSCAVPPAIRTVPLARVSGQHIDSFLPDGPDASRWAALMSEAQMLLFQSPVNQAREAAGRPAVNGLWCWGGGVWQQPLAPPALAIGSGPLVRGLATAAGIDCVDLSDADVVTPPTAGARRVVVVWGTMDEALRDQDEDVWWSAAAALDAWLAPLPAALRSGRVGELRILPCDATCRVVRARDLRWYRRLLQRPRPLAERASAAPTTDPRAG